MKYEKNYMLQRLIYYTFQAHRKSSLHIFEKAWECFRLFLCIFMEENKLINKKTRKMFANIAIKYVWKDEGKFLFSPAYYWLYVDIMLKYSSKPL